ncbi:MAG TPA: glycosyltransferase family 4 protein [Candidatus Krumholzibacteria bacterium]|nr:glycosyltransferase family 4 protein [Candidatus Krumholzibacteria bacterium]
MNRVLVVAYYFPPAGAVGVYRTLKFVKYLPDFGWSPTVVTTANGKFPTYDASLLRLIPEGVAVHRARGSETLNEGFDREQQTAPGKTLRSRIQTRLYLWWHAMAVPDTRVGWVPGAFRLARRLMRQHHIRHVYVSGYPFSSFLVAVLLKRACGARVVIDYRDPWTQSITYERRGLRRWVDRKVEAWMVRQCDAVISNTRHNDARMAAEFGDGQPREKFVAIHNGFDADDFAHIPRARTEKFTVTYAGAFYYSVGSDYTGGLGDAMKTYSPLYFFQALEAFFARRPEAKGRTRVRFMGVLGQGYDPHIAQHGLETVIERVGYIDYDEHLRVLKNSDALLLVLSRGEKSRGWIPSKFFQYLGTGNPILAMAPAGEVREIVHETRAGVCVEPDDVDGASRAIESLYDAWVSETSPAQRNEAAVAQYERRNLTHALARVLERL